MSKTDGQPRDKQSWDYILRSGLAGGFAGCVAKTAVAPLDRVKILFQASNPEFAKYASSWSGMFRAAMAISQRSGLRGLLQGHSATLIRVFPYAAINYVGYDQLHHILMPTREQETPLRRFVAGATAGALSVFFVYPLDLLRVRMAFQTQDLAGSGSPIRPSLRRAIQTIYHEGEGTIPLPSHSPSAPSINRQNALFHRFPILHFYRGFSVTLLGIVPYAGTSFLVYGTLRSLIYNSHWWKQDPSKRKSSHLINLCIGAVSGMISQGVSYPFETVRRRMQVGGLTRPTGWLGGRELVRDIWKTKGWKGFYVGLTVGYAKMVPMTAISFMVWEWSKSHLGL